MDKSNTMSRIIKLGIAEDHQLLRETFIKCLNQQKNITFLVEAKNGEDLINKISIRKVDVVILDIRMPVMDGWQTLKVLSNRYPLIRIIVLSMFHSEYHIIKAIKLGANAVLSKDVSMETLIEAIESVYEDGFYYDKESYRALHSNTINMNSDTKFHEIQVLTRREREILKLICKGRTNKEIAEILFKSVRTIESHRKSILNKTECPNVASLVVFAIKNKLYDIETG